MRTSHTGTNKVGMRSLGKRDTNTFGYVVIPKDRTRSEYIQYCKRTFTVAVFTENSEFIRNVRVGRNIMDWIRFPEESEDEVPFLGDAVLLSNIDLHSKPVIVDIFPKDDEFGSGKEHDFNIGKEHNDVDINISGDAESGTINIDVDSGSKEGSFNINVTNDSNNCNIKLFCLGDIDIISKDNDNESSISVKANEIQMKSEEGVIKHNEGTESMVLGDTLKNDVVDVILETLESTTVATMLGAQPLSTLIDFNELRLNVTETILSEKSKLD